MSTVRRGHPLTPRQAAVLEELREWGEEQLDLELQIDLHRHEGAKIVGRALEAGCYANEIAQRMMINRTTLYRRYVWKEKVT